MRTKENSHLPTYYTNKSIREKIDKCLHQINANHAQHSGIDSTSEDLVRLNEMNEPLLEKIKELDIEFFKEIYL
jgi:hypothetical protein